MIVTIDFSAWQVSSTGAQKMKADGIENRKESM